MTRFARILMLLMLLLIPATAAMAQPEAVLKVRLQGLERVEPASVYKVLYTREGMQFDYERIKKDVKAVFDLGFFSDVQVDRQNLDDGVVLTYILVERPSIKEIKIEGNDEINNDDLMEVIDIKPHAILDYDRISETMESIRVEYIKKGYYLADVGFRLEDAEDNQVILVFEIKERAKVLIKKVILAGNEKISDEELESVMMAKPGDFLSFLSNKGKFQHELVDRDAYFIGEYYANHGYIEAIVAPPKVYISPDRQWIYITFQIQEGKQYSLGSVEFSGDLIFPLEKLHSMISLKEGEIFNKERFMHDIEYITTMYKDLGYAYTNVIPLNRVDSDKLIVNFDVQIQKGKKVRIERINIVGNTKTRDKVIRREMRIAEGDWYSVSGVRLSKREITQLGFFETVEITEEPGSADDKIVLNVEVKERRTGTFQLGFGFSSIDSFVFQSQINQNNLFGRGQSLSLMAMLSSRRNQIALRFHEPYLFDTKLQFGFSLYRQSVTFPQQGEFGSYSRQATGVDFTIGYPFWDDVTLALTYTIQDTKLDVGTNVHLHLFKSGVTSSFMLSATYDTRNNRLFPTDGQLHRFWTEYADSYTGSQIEFMKYGWSSQFFFPVWWKFVFKINTEVGYIMSLEEPDANTEAYKDYPGVPIAERFLLGGIYTIRGYEYGSISPSIVVMPQDEPAGYPTKFLIGGNKQLILNLELEFPIIEQAGIRWVLFFDAGNTWSEEEQFFYLGQGDQDPYDLPLGLYMSYGFGLRWYSPIGPLRFEWGIPVTKRPQDNDIAFEFSIGNQF